MFNMPDCQGAGNGIWVKTAQKHTQEGSGKPGVEVFPRSSSLPRRHREQRNRRTTITLNNIHFTSALTLDPFTVGSCHKKGEQILVIKKVPMGQTMIFFEWQRDARGWGYLTLPFHLGSPCSPDIRGE